MLNSCLAGIPISSSTKRSRNGAVVDLRGANGGAVTGSGGRLHFGMVAGIKSEWRPASYWNA
jgi:hypothetical protein